MATQYNANDPVPQAFLSALAGGETGGNANAATEGYGGANLSGAATDAYGFPLWSGVNTSAGLTHAAGIYQFQQPTWDSIAAQYGLNFANPQDQSAGAWDLAQQQYAAKTGGDLETALQQGNVSSVQSALGSTWTSLANSSVGTAISNALSSLSGSSSSNSTSSASTSSGTISSIVSAAFGSGLVRVGLIVVGSVIILVALWMLLADNNILPHPADVAKGAAVGLAAA